MWVGPFVGSLCLVSYNVKRNVLFCFSNRFLKAAFYFRPTVYMCHLKWNLVFLFLKKMHIFEYLYLKTMTSDSRQTRFTAQSTLHGNYDCRLQIHYLIIRDQESQERGWGGCSSTPRRSDSLLQSGLFCVIFTSPLNTLSDLLRWSLNKGYYITKILL